MARVCSSLLLSLLIAAATNATPLAFPQADVTWASSMMGGVRSNLSVHFQDLDSATPGVGLIQLEISGHIRQSAFERFRLESSFLSVYGGVYDNLAHNAVRFTSLETEFDRGDGTSATSTTGLTGFGDPITYTGVRFAPAPSRLVEWHATVQLAVYGLDLDPINLQFVHAFQGAVPAWCNRLLIRHCLDGLHHVDILEITATPLLSTASAGLRGAMIPEPSTGLLLSVGVLGIARWRRARA